MTLVGGGANFEFVFAGILLAIGKIISWRVSEAGARVTTRLGNDRLVDGLACL